MIAVPFCLTEYYLGRISSLESDIEKKNGKSKNKTIERHSPEIDIDPPTKQNENGKDDRCREVEHVSVSTRP